MPVLVQHIQGTVGIDLMSFWDHSVQLSQMAFNSKPSGHRMKLTEMSTSETLVNIWVTFDLVVFKVPLRSFTRLA